jgi:hypothetical protein
MSQAIRGTGIGTTRPVITWLSSLRHLSAVDLSSTAFTTMALRLLVSAGSPGSLSGLSQVVGSVIVPAPRFTMCPNTTLVQHNVEVELGGECAFNVERNFFLKSLSSLLPLPRAINRHDPILLASRMLTG